ncbi:MAG: putative manganese-dependent inorganic diphosphatase [Thermodesulfobacteriota bacterium]
MGTVYVIGHKNPDTDSVCSAIALARLKKELGLKNVVAARAGDLNPQTTFILERLGIEPPLYVPDVHPRARDVMAERLFTVSPGTPLIKVIKIMEEEKVRFIPVIEDDGRPYGVITLMSLARKFMVATEPGPARLVLASTDNIREALGGKSLLDFTEGEQQTLSLFVGAMGVESFLSTIQSKGAEGCVVIVGDREDIQRETIDLGVRLLIVSGGFDVSEGVLALAEEKGVSLIVSPFDSATTAQIVRLSTPASMICNTAFETIGRDELTDSIKYRLEKVTGLMVVNKKGVLQGLVTRSRILRPSPVSLILVDHNELAQAVDGAAKVEIKGVVDHHRIGGFQSVKPIPFVCGPVGSTSTLVAQEYESNGVTMDKDMAGLLLAGVLSDTVLLKSPTATDRDRDMVKTLEGISGLDSGAFGEEIFRATSSLKKRGPEAVVKGDHKVFTAAGKTFGIGQVETIGFDEFYKEKDNLRKVLQGLMAKKGLLLSALLVTDIVLGTSLFLAVGVPEVFFNLGYREIDKDVYELKGVISRKKQVVPHILNVFNEIY